MSVSYPLPANELERLAALNALEILDTPPEENFDRIARLVQLIFDVPIALLTMMDANRQWYKACVGTSRTSIERDNAFCRFTVADGLPMVVEDAKLDARFRDHAYVTGAPEIRFYAAAPILLDGDKCVGTICAIDMKPRRVSDKDLAILRELASIAVSELELRRTAQIDFLTQVMTRRHFMKMGQRQLNDRRTSNLPIAVVTFDLDHFKPINDTYGHAAGDAVLARIAETCQMQLRETDIMGRLGGEEFAVLLPHTDLAGGLAVAEKLRFFIEQTETLIDGNSIKATASFGVAATTVSAPLEQLLNSADLALYRAKASGRNQVEAQTW